jgi:hypothetical protein
MADNRENNRKQDDNKERRGFAAMDPEKQRKIASEGGKASHENDSDKGNRGNRQSQNR